MNSKEVREKFLKFFQDKEHKIVPSAPIVVRNDPTLMFTNAGMNQFKDYFLGNRKPEHTRIADTQKCLRVSGKHNDLEEVGLDTYHHTMFEMLGNWSFGDYFKEEAIKWAWELLTKVYKLPEDRLYASVFGGDEEEDLQSDKESYQIWKNIIPQQKILYGSKKDNFWEMGETGPCGPCSEIHMDLRSEEEIKKIPGKELINKDHPLVVELWNLVFIEFNRKSNGELESLPQKHVDTGMGLERLLMTVQEKKSNYDTDLFKPLIKFTGDLANIKYGEKAETDIALRVIVDHIRAISFSIADGQLPSNTGAGYVIRRILRRAIRYGYTFLKFRKPFLHKLLPILNEQFGQFFPEIAEQKEFIAKVIKEEESSFLRTLETGLKKLEQIKKEASGKVIQGKQAFELYDTYGFPLDLTSLIAGEDGYEVNEEGFHKEMEKQKGRSKADAAKETGDWVDLNGEEDVQFVGYDQLESETRVIKYRKLKEKGRELVQLVLDKTPFYPESGGQVGDTGYLIRNGEKIRIFDTQKENELIIHYAEKLPEDPKGQFKAVVDKEKRRLTMNNHSATHLLHAALREVLGDHVVQKGSLVNDKLLRFDFSHFAKVTDEELSKIEEIVNHKIREDIPIMVQEEIPLEEAKDMGAMALFGEKYGESVRVVTFDKDFSVELCGGTHVPSTGRIGYFKIISESSIAAGVRRVEAVTAMEAEKYVKDLEKMISELRSILKNPRNLKKAVKDLVNEKQKLAKELESLRMNQAKSLKSDLIKEIRELNGARVLIKRVTLPNVDALKKLSFELRNEVDDLFLVLAAEIGNKPQIAVALSDSIIKEKGLNASEIVKELAKEIKGGGGGQPFFAMAGGKETKGLVQVVKNAEQFLN